MDAWELPEWRCTRLDLYPRGTPVEDMQGHYIRAKSEAEARSLMLFRYPGERVSVTFWKEALPCLT